MLEGGALCLSFQNAEAKLPSLKRPVSSLASRVSGMTFRTLCLSPIILNIVVLFVILEY